MSRRAAPDLRLHMAIFLRLMLTIYLLLLDMAMLIISATGTVVRQSALQSRTCSRTTQMRLAEHQARRLHYHTQRASPPQAMQISSSTKATLEAWQGSMEI